MLKLPSIFRSIRFLFVGLLLLGGLHGFSQTPVAAFTANRVSGCAPLSVAFTDQSTGDPKFWNWDLGNGTLSNQQNPVVVYSTPGTYTVSLVVRNSNGADAITKTAYITVNPSPTAMFTANITTACLGSTIQFTDQSSTPDGSIQSWLWNFGDGTTSTERNPSKTYPDNGFYNVSLTVTSSTGCTHTRSVARYIRILSGVTAEFFFRQDSVCRAPFPVHFSNQTSGPGSMTYIWDMGNGSTATTEDATTSYNAEGTYTVQLIARSEYGCADTITKTVPVTGANAVITAPSSGCINQPVNFVNGSTPTAVSSYWDFGDGTTGSGANISKTFNQAGVYEVKLVTDLGFCKDSTIHNLTIPDLPAVNFTGTNLTGCKGPLTADFQPQAPEAVSWFWDFGDGQTSTLQAPSNVYNNPGVYDVRLTITNANGCTNTILKTAFAEIRSPEVTIPNSSPGGCAPFSFTTSANVNAIDGVSSWSWTFGEGATPITSQNPTYIYNTPGNYQVQVTITTTGGCTATASRLVQVGTPAIPEFSATNLSPCLSDLIDFTDESSQADRWSWDFGDGNTSSLQNPTHRYEAPGQYTVTLTSFNNGCPQTISKTQYIDVKPPMADFEYDIDCSNLQNVNFTNTSVTDPSKGAISFAWQFGDPSSNNSTDISPSFIYPGIGSYSVTLTATNGGCTHSVTKIVTLADVSADFEASETTVCRSGVFTIEAVKSNPDLISQYEWTINGGTPFIGPRSFETSFPANGVYSVGLRIIDINGCEAMLNRPDYITVQGPFASFTAAATNGCPFEPVTFTDNSDSDAPLISWTFNFGNGDTQSFGSAPFTYHYTDTGWYNVTLTVTDNDGCSDAFTLADAIHITKPTASFSAERTLFCPGGELAFYDSSKGYTLTHSWNFGDQGTSTDPSPVHIYQGDDAVYSVELIVTDMYGCKDTLLKQDYITIVRPKPAFDLIDSSSICPPLETKFFRKGTDYESFYWDFGDGTVSELDNPVNFFNTYGSYEVRLYVTGYGGCVEYASQQVNVYNPYSYTNISMSPITSCNELTVDFGINTPPATRFVFYYGDGTSDTTGTRNLSHFYDFPRNYAPYLILTDSLDCTVTVGGPSTIRIIGAVPIFSPDKKNFCDESIVYFRNFTQGNDPIVSTVWDFADGTTSTDQEPTHFFNTPGVYPVTLTVTTEANCTKSFIDTIRVYNTPEPIIFSDDLVCLNELIAFQGQLALADTSITWNWNLGNGVTTQNADTSTSYTRAGTVTVNLSATNLLGCSGSTSKSITVAPLPEILFESDPVVPVGSSITIPVTYSPNVVQWIWTPSNTLNCNNCGNPVATPQFTTTYRVDVTDANGCKNSSDVTVKVICNEENYFVPNTFSPNNDGINDVFYPRGKGIHRVESMKIFNRWGQLIFERRNFMANDANAGWDGTIKGKPAEADTYVYIVEFICENATIIPFKGNVTLIR